MTFSDGPEIVVHDGPVALFAGSSAAWVAESNGDALVEFLEARIAEDEALAGMADGSRMRGAVHSSPACYSEDVLYLRRHDPERVLAECEAKRRIIALHSDQWGGGRCHECERSLPCRTLRALALPYADHPDYLEEWRL